ncbi:hypothetical protein GQ42DRAFT_160173 [Ramicandelaber brevisporus]|nr:hypothetical protein GQ42DRAFT_160173 [Ramicandelaber brevisporus]
MDHGSHGGGHGGMDMGGGAADKGPACVIGMLWNWDMTNRCFIFSTWQTTSKGWQAGTWLIIFFTCVVYQLAKNRLERWEAMTFSQPAAGSCIGSEKNGFSEENGGSLPVYKKSAHWQKWLSALLTGIQMFFSYMIMLLTMYYNGWIILAVVLGLAFGRLAVLYLFEKYPAPRGSSECCN